MKTYKVINQFSDRLAGFAIRKPGEKLVLSDERGAELFNGGYVEELEDGGNDNPADNTGTIVSDEPATGSESGKTEADSVENSLSDELRNNLANSLKAVVDAKKGKGKPVVTKEEKNV